MDVLTEYIKTFVINIIPEQRMIALLGDLADNPFFLTYTYWAYALMLLITGVLYLWAFLTIPASLGAFILYDDYTMHPLSMNYQEGDEVPTFFMVLTLAGVSTAITCIAPFSVLFTLIITGYVLMVKGYGYLVVTKGWKKPKSSCEIDKEIYQKEFINN